MNLDDIKDWTVAEILGAPCTFIDMDSGRKRKGTVWAVYPQGLRILRVDGILTHMNLKSVVSVTKKPAP